MITGVFPEPGDLWLVRNAVGWPLGAYFGLAAALRAARRFSMACEGLFDARAPSSLTRVGTDERIDARGIVDLWNRLGIGGADHPAPE